MVFDCAARTTTALLHKRNMVEDEVGLLANSLRSIGVVGFVAERDLALTVADSFDGTGVFDE